MVILFNLYLTRKSVFFTIDCNLNEFSYNNIRWKKQNMPTKSELNRNRIKSYIKILLTLMENNRNNLNGSLKLFGL